MSIKELVSKYIACSEQVISEIGTVETYSNVGADDVMKIMETAKAYLEDAKYYRDKKRFEVSLASVAYCEGLLDALKLLGAVRFEWPTKKQ